MLQSFKFYYYQFVHIRPERVPGFSYPFMTGPIDNDVKNCAELVQNPKNEYQKLQRASGEENHRRPPLHRLVTFVRLAEKVRFNGFLMVKSKVRLVDSCLRFSRLNIKSKNIQYKWRNYINCWVTTNTYVIPRREVQKVKAIISNTFFLGLSKFSYFADSLGFAPCIEIPGGLVKV